MVDASANPRSDRTPASPRCAASSGVRPSSCASSSPTLSSGSWLGPRNEERLGRLGRRRVVERAPRLQDRAHVGRLLVAPLQLLFLVVLVVVLVVRIDLVDELDHDALVGLVDELVLVGVLFLELLLPVVLFVPLVLSRLALDARVQERRLALEALGRGLVGAELLAQHSGVEVEQRRQGLAAQPSQALQGERTVRVQVAEESQ